MTAGLLAMLLLLPGADPEPPEISLSAEWEVLLPALLDPKGVEARLPTGLDHDLDELDLSTFHGGTLSASHR
ncbi:MAG: hypothetical protein ACYTAF_09185, partial [Planctomycetota bacterium]